jgi:hypothetical protein
VYVTFCPILHISSVPHQFRLMHVQISMLWKRVSLHVVCFEVRGFMYLILKDHKEVKVVTEPFPNSVSLHEGVSGEWRYNSTHS